MLSYHADMTLDNNPYEMGLDRLVQVDMEADFIGKKALRSLRDNGVSQKQIGLLIDGDPLTGPNTQFWSVYSNDVRVGKVTSAIYSPRLKRNIALALVENAYIGLGTELIVDTNNNKRNAQVSGIPFYDAKKKLVTS